MIAYEVIVFFVGLFLMALGRIFNNLYILGFGFGVSTVVLWWFAITLCSIGYYAGPLAVIAVQLFLVHRLVQLNKEIRAHTTADKNC